MCILACVGHYQCARRQYQGGPGGHRRPIHPRTVRPPMSPIPALTRLYNVIVCPRSAYAVQLLLRLDRPDLAQQRLVLMKSVDEDSVLTQLATAWVDTRMVRTPPPDPCLTERRWWVVYVGSICVNPQCVCVCHCMVCLTGGTEVCRYI